MLVDVCFILYYCSIYCYDTSLLRDMQFSIIFIVVLFLIIVNILGTPRRFIEVPYEPVYEISNNAVCATSKGSDKPAHMRSLIRAFASRLSIL